MSNTLISTADILPTLAGILGLPWRSQWEGRDALGPVDSERAVFASAKCRAPWLRDLEMIRTGDMKLIREYKTGREALYNLGADPMEDYDLVPEQPDIVRELRTMLHVHLLNNARANGTDASLRVMPGMGVEEGKSVPLTAPEGTGHIWFRNGVPVDDLAPRIAGVNGPVLIIDPVLYGDAGFYECMYSDVLLHQQVTTAHDLLVLSDEEVPAAGPRTLLMLVFILGAASLRRMVLTCAGTRCHR